MHSGYVAHQQCMDVEAVATRATRQSKPNDGVGRIQCAKVQGNAAELYGRFRDNSGRVSIALRGICALETASGTRR